MTKFILWKQYHSDSKLRWRYYNNKRKSWPLLLIKIDANIINKIFAIQIQEHINKVIHYDQTDYIQKGNVVSVYINQ